MATASNVPTFGELLNRVRKVNPRVGIVEDGYFYDTTELSEEQKFRWTSSIIRFSIVNYMSKPTCTKDNLIKVYHGFTRFNHYSFVKRLENEKILSSEKFFDMMEECLYNDSN